MTDHPFDEIAVEAAMASLLTNVHRASWTKDRMSAALTAACNSMKERGKSASGFADFKPDDAAIIIAKRLQHATTSPVTIFRHGE